jgi:hypothetical protein
MKKEKTLIKLKKVIADYLDSKVKTPALNTVDKELYVQEDIVNMLVILKIINNLILQKGDDLDLNTLTLESKELLENKINILEKYLKQPDNHSATLEADKIIESYYNKKHLFIYLEREINWIAISLLSASYISSLILMRSIFELIIGIATHMKGSMTDRLDSIYFLYEDERKQLKRDWNELNAWCHPYSKWEKGICPIFYSHPPLYHPELYKLCIAKLRLLSDFALIIAVEKFKIDPEEIAKDSHFPAYIDKILPFFNKRIEKSRKHLTR